MLYQYRWYCAAVIAGIISFIGYALDSQPNYNNLLKLQVDYQQLSEQVAFYQKQQLNKHGIRSMREVVMEEGMYSLSDVLATLSLIEHNSNVRIQSITHLSSGTHHQLNFKKVQLLVNGSFEEIYSFIHLLSNYPLVILDFNYHAKTANQVVLLLDVLVILNKMVLNTHYPVRPTKLYNPLCKVNYFRSNHDELSKLSLRKMKMVGFIERAKQKIALLAAENHVVLDLKQGDRAGVERGVINEIRSDRIIFLLPNQEKIILKMESHHG